MSDSLTGNGLQGTLMLSDGVHIYYNGADEVRLRKGIWNFEEAILTFDGLSKGPQREPGQVVRPAARRQRSGDREPPE